MKSSKPEAKIYCGESLPSADLGGAPHPKLKYNNNFRNERVLLTVS